MTSMPRGESGRIVVEIDPEMKRRLYAALALSGSTLKDWFIRNASSFCDESAQPSLFSGIEPEKASTRASTTTGIHDG